LLAEAVELLKDRLGPDLPRFAKMITIADPRLVREKLIEIAAQMPAPPPRELDPAKVAELGCLRSYARAWRHRRPS
jgi:hypothetical protein